MNENTLIWIAVLVTVIILLPLEKKVAKSMRADKEKNEDAEAD